MQLQEYKFKYKRLEDELAQSRLKEVYKNHGLDQNSSHIQYESPIKKTPERELKDDIGSELAQLGHLQTEFKPAQNDVLAAEGEDDDDSVFSYKVSEGSDI